MTFTAEVMIVFSFVMIIVPVITGILSKDKK